MLVSQGQSVAEAVRLIGVTQFIYYRWRKEFGGLKSDQVKRLKDLEKDRASGSPSVRELLARERLRMAISDLTLEKLILKEAAAGTKGLRQRNFLAPPAAAVALITSGRSSAFRNASPAVSWASTARSRGRRRAGGPMKRR